MIKKIRNAACIALVGLGIILFGAMLVAVCVAFYPLRLIFDREQLKMSSLCFKCAEERMDRKAIMQIVYHRPEGEHRCSNCGKPYVVIKS